MATAGKTISIVIIVVILILMIIYIIVLFETYKNQTFMFTKYTPPPPPTSQNGFYPLGNVIPLTQEQIDERNAIITASANLG